MGHTDPDRHLRVRDDLKDVRGPRRPAGYKPGWDLEERLIGLVLMAIGVGGLVLSAFLLGGAAEGRLSPVLGFLPILMALGGVGMVAVGLKQFLNP